MGQNYTSPITGKQYNPVDWNSVAYDTAYHAFELGQDFNTVQGNQKKYVEPTQRAYADWLARQRGNGGGGGSSSSSTTAAANIPTLPTLAPPAAGTTAPIVEPKLPDLPSLPALELNPDSSVTNQLAKLQSVDSVPMQQALIKSHEIGAATGAIHSSQQAGAAQRAVQNAMMPLAEAEANRVATTDIANWSTKVKAINDTYEKEYSGYLAKLNISSSEKQAMMAANTSMSQSLLSTIGALLGNPDIEFGEEVKNKLTSIYNGALKNNNVILDMGFTYA